MASVNPKLSAENNPARPGKSLRKKREMAPRRRWGTQFTAEPICQYNNARAESKAPNAAKKYQRRKCAGSVRLRAPASEKGEALTSGSNFTDRQLNQTSRPARLRIR